MIATLGFTFTRGTGSTVLSLSKQTPYFNWFLYHAIISHLIVIWRIQCRGAFTGQILLSTILLVSSILSHFEIKFQKQHTCIHIWWKQFASMLQNFNFQTISFKNTLLSWINYVSWYFVNECFYNCLYLRNIFQSEDWDFGLNSKHVE